MAGLATIVVPLFVHKDATCLVVLAPNPECALAQVGTLETFATTKSAPKLSACTVHSWSDTANVTALLVGLVPTAHRPCAIQNVWNMAFVLAQHNANVVRVGRARLAQSPCVRMIAVVRVFVRALESAIVLPAGEDHPAQLPNAQTTAMGKVNVFSRVNVPAMRSVQGLIAASLLA